MIKFLLKISQLTIFVMVMLFALSSNKHVIKYFFGSMTKEYVHFLETESESKKDSTEKSETEKKEKCDYYLSDFSFNFDQLIQQKMESLHKENSIVHIFQPQSPPPEYLLS